MPTPSSNEVYIRVRIDASGSMGEIKKVTDEASAGFKRFSRVAAGTLSFLFGGIAREATSKFSQLGDLMGRGTVVGAEASQFYARLGAKLTAADKTTEAFGFAGKTASVDQILALYNTYKKLDTMEAESKARVRSVIGSEVKEETQNQVWKDLTFALNNLGTVIREFLGVFRGR